jgi:acetoacetyl-CoA synthetase
MRPTRPGEVVWTPPDPEATRLAEFRRRLAASGGPALADYDALHRFSVRSPGPFWRAVWAQCGLCGDPGDRDLVDAERPYAARFFPDGRLNFAENLLRWRGEGTAVIGRDETGHREALSHDALRRRVAGAMERLVELGLQPGDRVAAIVPNRVDTLVLLLAVAGLGGVWSACSPDFGVPAALDRFRQVRPRFLVGCDGYVHGGRPYDTRPRLAAVARALPELAATLVLPVLEPEPDLAGIPGAERAPVDRETETLRFVERAFLDPLYVMFSSGTTGAPKCILHGVGGTLLQHVKEHQLHCELRPGDGLLFHTTCGWMMWNWLVSALASGVTVALWDGSPVAPDALALPRFVAEEGLTHLGVSPGWLAALERADARPREALDLGALRMLLSTGAPLPAEAWGFVRDAFGEGVQTASITGGTDLLGCFALGCPEKPVRAGEIQVPGLGMDVDFVDEQGRSVRGRRGELVCRSPFPSQPLAFLDDPDGARLRRAYFEPWPKLWRHGDFGAFTEAGGIVIHGRSDAVLNRGGVRIGTAELYRQVDRVPGIVESLAVTRERDGALEIVLFVVPTPGVALDDALEARIRAAVRDGASPRHVPDRIAAVPEIPVTRSGKRVELAVRDLLAGEEPENTSALANPEALEHFRDHPALRGP